MTIAKTGNRAQYTGDGATTAFAFTYRFFDDTDLGVYVLSVAGAETKKTMTIDYSVTNNDDETGGTVTFLSPPADGEIVTILGEIPQTQSVDLEDNDAFPADTAETAFDRAVRLVHQLSEILGRTIKLPISTTLSELTLPTPSGGAALGWNANGTALVNLTALEAEVGVDAGTDNAVMRYEASGGGLQDSGIIIDDSDNVTLPGDLNITGDHKIELADARTGEMIDLGSDDQARYINFSGSRGRFGYDGSHGYVGGGSSRGLKFKYNLTTDGGFMDASGKWRLGDGSDPTVTLEVAGTDAMLLPVGTTAQEPAATAGHIRYDSTIGALRVADGSAWATVATANPVKAWVTFNGTGTVAIINSFNVASITDNGTGDYTINFTNSFGANYAVIGTGIAGASDVNYVVGFPDASAIADGSVRVNVRNRAGGLVDADLISIVAIQ